MKRLTLAVTAVALAVASSQGALAATKPKPKPKPVAVVAPVTTTYYFHSPSQVGNQDSNVTTGSYLSMDGTKPAGTTDHHFGYFGAAASPNPECAGSLLFPNFIGKAAGTMTGTMKVSFYAESTPGASATVQVFADVAGQLCNSNGTNDMPDPIGQATVALPVQPGLVTVSIPVQGKGKVFSSFDVQIQDGSTAGLVGPQLSDVLFDSTTSPSSITWTCLPKTGATTC